MIKIVLKVSPMIVLLATLAGCAGMNGRFGCNARAGRSCTPVSQVNARANSGYYTYEASWGRQISLPTRNKSTQGSKNQVFPYPGQPIRTSERIQRIWIAPYQDLSSNYHDPSTVYAVLEKPHWTGQPVNEVKTTETQQDD